MGTIKNPEGIWGIITGDIVRSRLLPDGERERLQDYFYKDVFHSLGLFSAGIKVYGPQIFRGDSWQMAVFPATHSLKIGIMLRAVLKSEFDGTDTRVAIAVGQIMLLIEEYVSAGLGPAYTLSGDLLDQMISSRMMLRTQKDHIAQTEIGKSIEMIVRYMDDLVTKWTPAQAQAMLGELRGVTQERIAINWKPEQITQQAVSAHLKAANWKLVIESLQFVESLIDDWDNLEEAK